MTFVYTGPVTEPTPRMPLSLIESDGETMTPHCQLTGCHWSGDPVDVHEAGSADRAHDLAFDDLTSHLMVEHPWLVTA